MKKYRIIWTERHSADIEAESEEQAEEAFRSGKSLGLSENTYNERELEGVESCEDDEGGED